MACVAIAAALLYIPRLEDSPFYLNRDEMFFGLTAHSVATTGRDTTGRVLPLYFQTEMRYGSEMWFQPSLMYAATLCVKLFGLSAAAIRLPMALAGVIDVALVYAVARVLVGRDLPALVAAVLLMAAPAHFIHAREALDFQAPLPFMLGWLLCLLLYLRDSERGSNRPPHLLFAAGLLLGVGIYTYIAAYMLMPIYAALTALVLSVRHESARAYRWLAAGFFLPAVACVPFLLSHPTVLHDVFWHYARDLPNATSSGGLFSSFFSYERFARAASVYAGFWNPRFLFANGPEASWVAGVFLVSTAGLFVVGVMHLLRRATPVALVLLAGLLTAPIPASLVGDGEAIHRAAAVVPFGVLVAIAGLDSLWTRDSARARAAAFAAIWIVVIGVAVTWHAELPQAQAFVRASTVPLAVVAIGWLWRASQSRTLGLVAAACIASGIFMFEYADYSWIHRVGVVPAAAIVLAARLLFAACGALVIVAVAWLFPRATNDSRTAGGVMAAAALAVVATEAMYFYIDASTVPAVRLLHTLAILALVIITTAMFERARTSEALGLGHLAAFAVLGLAAIQFASVGRDYFTQYRVHSGNGEPEGYARVAWERVIERARDRVPAVYLGQVGPYGFADLYWTFYALQYHREDLIAHTTSDNAFDPARLRALPGGSIAVASPSPAIDGVVASLQAAGELRDRTLVTAPDGRSRFWVLETREKRDR
jgi:4-amino-4-deoxy-L-arabinose transferase-like glycosyltransferase